MSRKISNSRHNPGASSNASAGDNSYYAATWTITGKQMTAGQSFMTMVVTGTPNRRSA